MVGEKHKFSFEANYCATSSAGTAIQLMVLEGSLHINHYQVQLQTRQTFSIIYFLELKLLTEALLTRN